jgi:hypothetical protein
MLGTITANAQLFVDDNEKEVQLAISTFYKDCQVHNVPLESHFFKVTVKSMKANAKVVIQKDGLYRVYLDKNFVEYYKGQSQLYTAVYHILGKSLLGLKSVKGNKIMNPERVYFKFTNKRREQFFNSI